MDFDQPSDHLGPAMASLNELQRRYVLAMLSDPLGNPTRWARTAGYSDTKEGCKVRGFYLARNPKITEAAQEEARRHLDTIGPVLGIGVMMQIAKTKGHKDQLRAAEALANRTGFQEVTEHKVTVEKRDNTGTAVIERIRRWAERHKLDPAQFIGPNVAMIEKPASEV